MTQHATYNIPVSINRYNLLAHEEGCRRNSATNRSHVVQSEYNGQVNKIDGGNKKPHNIVILRDSHARGCASEVQHNLNSNFEIQGMVKPGTDIKEIITPSTTTTMKLSKKDVVVIWGEGGTRDISRNETDSAICQIKMFVQTHKNMNAIVMEAPCRYDLDPTSRVNNEVKTFNRKLRKHMKIYSNARVIGIDSNREFYTKHGLHMNQKGKEQTAKKIGLEIKFRLKEKGGTPSHID